MHTAVNIYDVFCSYHGRDHPAVAAVARVLRDRGLTVFLDRWYLVPGRPWPEALEGTLTTCRAVAVFLGPQGMGPWQQREAYCALDRQTHDPSFPVIPVLLPGAEPALGFLALNTWVDLRAGLDDPLSLTVLTAALRGEPPGPATQERLTATVAAICPYRGLRPFREEDAPFFFGREAFTARLVAAVDRQQLVAVVGASGTGKSSVVRAGLVPRLRRGDGGRVWDVVTLVPGDRPLHALAAALVPLLEPEMTETDRLIEVGKLAAALTHADIALRDVVARVLEKQSGTDRLLMVVDQWEELYTLCREEQSCRRFLDAVLEATTNGPLTVVITLRGDFFGHALSDRSLADRLQDAVVTLGPMTQEELTQAIELPAQQTKLTFESGLVGRILEDVREEPGNLPLLEFALTVLWEARRGSQLCHEAYEAMGSLQGAIARRAEETFTRLTPLEQAAVRRIFLQVVRPGEQTEDTRRRATFAEIGQALRPVVQHMADARLLVTGRDESAGEETIEVAHEALIGHWVRLRTWLDEDRAFLLWRQRLRDALAGWRQTGHDEGGLLRGAPLAEAARWFSERPDDLSPDEGSFIRESMALRERERTAREQQQHRRVLTALGAALVFLILAALAGLQWWRAETQSQATEQQRQIANSQRVLAEEQRQMAEERGRQIQQQLVEFYTEQGRQELLKGDGRRAVVYLSEAYQQASQESGAQSSLRVLLALALRLIERVSLEGHAGSVYFATFSPDGTHIVTTSTDGTAKLWNAANGDFLVSFNGHTHWVLAAAFSPDGSRLVTASIDGTAKVWEVTSGRSLTSLAGHAGPVLSAAFAPDGSHIVTASEDGTAKVWDAAQGTLLFSLSGHAAGIVSATFSPDGRHLVTASIDGTAKVWEVTSGRSLTSLAGHAGPVLSAAFAPDSSHIVTASEDGTAKVWEVTSGRSLTSLAGHAGPLLSATFAPDGSHIVTASEDGTAKVWDAAQGILLISFPGHAAAVDSAMFSPDGSRLVTASRDGTARVWEVTSGLLIASLTGHTAKVVSAAFSPDGTRIVTASWDKTAKVWDAPEFHPLLSLDGASPVRSAAFAPNGSRLVTASADRRARVWDAATGMLLTSLAGHAGLVYFAAFSPDGSRIVTASADRTAKVWDAATGMLLTSLAGHAGLVYFATFSPDGNRIVTASEDGTARVWDTTSGTLLVPLYHADPVLAAAFSPDGSRLVTASWSKTALVWDAATGTLLTSLAGHAGLVYFAAFSPDGRRIVTASEDGTARVWDTASGTLLVPLYHAGPVLAAAFSPDGSRLVTASKDGTARVWDTVSGTLLVPLYHAGPVLAAAFSPDGSRLVTAGENGTARVWDLPLETRSGAEIADLVKRVVPWRLDQGRLIPASPNASAYSTHPSSMKQELGSLSISSREPVVEVWLGNRRLGMTRAGAEMPVDNLPIGRYRLTALKGGYEPWDREIEIVSNQVQQLIIDMDQPRVTQSGMRSAPVIRLSPSEDQRVVYDDRVYLEGRVTAASAIVVFAINGESLLHRQSRQPFFSYLASLQPGDNRFLLEAIDQVGNTARQEIIVTRIVRGVRKLISRPSLVLMPFEKIGEVPAPLSQTVDDYLLNFFVNHRRFEVIDRQMIGLVLQELRLSQSELVDPATVAKIGKIAAADGILQGTVRATGEGVEVNARLVDSETGVVIAAEDVYGESMSFRNISTLIDGLSRKIGNRLRSATEGFVTQKEGKKITINLSRKDGMVKDMKLILFRTGEEIKHPDSGKILGRDLEILAEARIDEVFEDFSRATLPQLTPSTEVRLWDRVIPKWAISE